MRSTRGRRAVLWGGKPRTEQLKNAARQNPLKDERPLKPPEPRSIISSNLAIQTRKEEDVRHPAHVWTDPAFEEESLQRLRHEYRRHVSSGPNKVAEKTVRKYFQDIDDFLRSMERHGVPLVLGSLTPDSVSLWAEDQEARGNSPHSITGRVISLKVFAHSFIYRTLELSKVDLLRKVERRHAEVGPPRSAQPG